MASPPPQQVKSAERVLSILELLGVSDKPLRLHEIADELAIPKSSALMLLRTLVARSYASQDATGGYALEASFRQGGFAAVNSLVPQILRLAAPVMQHLLEQFLETIVLGVLAPTHDVRVIGHRISPQAIRYDMTQLTVIPSYCTALGQAMLAFSSEEVVEQYIAQADFIPLTDKTITSAQQFRRHLRKVRRQGFAENLDERFVGASSTAVPVFDNRNAVVAALNIGTVTVRYHKLRPHIIPALKEAAYQLTAQLGGTPPKVCRPDPSIASAEPAAALQAPVK